MSKRFYRIEIIILALLSIVLLNAQNKNYNLSIEEILMLPEEEIDLGIACLTLAKDAYPDLRMKDFDLVLDYMVRQIYKYSQGSQEPLARIGAISTYLYTPCFWNDSLIFKYDFDDLIVDKKENRCLNTYLSSRKGSCVTMPMLYLVLTDRLNWPVQAVRVPEHFFCRYISDDLKWNNIETTSGGNFVPDEYYIEDFNIPEQGIQSGAYLRTLSKKEYIASLLVSNTALFLDNFEKMHHYLILALSIDSTLCNAHWNLGVSYFSSAKKLNDEMENNIAVCQAIHLNNTNKSWDQPVPKVPSPWDYQNRRKEEMRQAPKPSLLPTPMPSIIDQAINPASEVKRNPQPYPTFNNNDDIFVQKVNEIKSKYYPLINEFINRSEWHKNEAKEMGMVFETTEEQFTQDLIDAFNTYNNSVIYAPLPIGSRGNSNSMIGSVLRAAGSNFKPKKWSPGWNKNVLPHQRKKQ
jgi:hypothetical protein